MFADDTKSLGMIGKTPSWNAQVNQITKNVNSDLSTLVRRLQDVVDFLTLITIIILINNTTSF